MLAWQPPPNVLLYVCSFSSCKTQYISLSTSWPAGHAQSSYVVDSMTQLIRCHRHSRWRCSIRLDRTSAARGGSADVNRSLQIFVKPMFVQYFNNRSLIYSKVFAILNTIKNLNIETTRFKSSMLARNTTWLVWRRDETSVAVDCWDKHKRNMAIRGIN